MSGSTMEIKKECAVDELLQNYCDDAIGNGNRENPAVPEQDKLPSQSGSVSIKEEVIADHLILIPPTPHVNDPDNTFRERYKEYRKTPAGQKHQRDRRRLRETPEQKQRRNAKKRQYTKLRQKNRNRNKNRSNSNN